MARPTIPQAERKVPDTYSLHPLNIAWLAKRAASLSKQKGKRVSTSSILDALVTNIRLNQENTHGKNDTRQPNRSRSSHRAG